MHNQNGLLRLSPTAQSKFETPTPVRTRQSNVEQFKIAISNMQYAPQNLRQYKRNIESIDIMIYNS